MTEAATESSRPWWRPSVSVRLRITAAVVALAALALAGVGVTVYYLQQQRLHDSVDGSVERELARFDGIAGEETYQTGSVQRLLRAAVARAVPTPAERVVAFVDGALEYQRLDDREEDLRRDELFNQVVDDLIAAGGGSGDFETDLGTRRIAVRVVEGPDVTGAMVFAFSLDEVEEELAETMRTYVVVAGLALLVVAIGAYVVSGRLLRPIRDLRETAQEISETDLTRRITATGNDDLTDLTVTFNDMLDRLEGAFSTQRQFLDDVGHELKTPITIVRGQLEVMDAADRREVEGTVDLVLDEVDRMGRLVEELIVLAKTRRPDFLHFESTDLAALTDVIFDKMRGLAVRDWKVDDRATVWSDVDPQRLTQAALQLAANAVRHTDDGDEIAIGSRVANETVLLWVRDTGEGISLDQQARVFERFRRGTDQGEGSGLGLAIVRGIAQAHGGGIRLESEPTHGATFTLTFPLARDGRGRSR